MQRIIFQTYVPKYTVKCMIISTAYGSKSFCSIYYNIADNKICPDYMFKIMFDNDFLVTLVIIARKRIVMLLLVHCL